MDRYSDRSQWKVSLACISAIFGLFIAGPLFAQDDSDAVATDEGTADLGMLEVTGSRIKRLDIEGPSPIVIVTRDDIEARGFGTVYEALENLTQNTGTLQTEAFTNQFTPNAQSLNLRNLGGGRTLVLLNGRRVADYPQPYNSQSNFFNFATIPAAAIERIEILTGSASAVYGSDAIAGVVNIILRDDVTAPTLTVRRGSTKDGGGDSLKASFVWGKQWDRSSITIAAEHQSIDPIFGKDRDYLDDVTDAPQLSGNVPFSRAALIYSGFYGSPNQVVESPGNYYDPGEQACLDMQSQGVPYVYAYRDGRGNYCGRDDYGDETIQNERDRNSVYVNYRADISDSTSFYADAMYWDSSAANKGFNMWWGGRVYHPTIVADDGNLDGGTRIGDLVYIQRIFHSNETGSQENTYDESATNVTIGFEGSFSNFWNWDAGVTYSTNDYHQRQWRMKEEVADVYFAGTTEIDVCIPLLGFACGVFYPDYSTAQFNLYESLDQADIDALMGQLMIDSKASVWSAFAEIDGDLMEMPNGPLQFAAVVEFASQEYDITPDDRLLDQTGAGWWGRSGTGGGGERDRIGVGVEFVIPLASTLRATVAARYDDYRDDSNVGGAATYGIGLEYRPTDTLLLRTSFNTSFRAPDMHYLFAADSGFFSSTRDIYKCRQEAIDGGTTYNELDCDYWGFAGSRSGNLDLAEEEGESLIIGVVFNPLNNFSMSLDYFDIELRDAVRDMSFQQLARDEADCRLGVDTNGDSVDLNSFLCTDALARVTRDEDVFNTGEIQDFDTFFVGAINASFRRLTGFDASLTYSFETESLGDFRYSIDYTHILKDERQLFDFDPIDKDYRDNLQNFNARSTVNMSLGWDYRKFSSTLYSHRLGSMPNWQETGRLGSWFIYNLSTTMRFMDDKLIASLVFNNLLDQRPPVDDGFTSWPFFWRGQYNAIGRQTYLQLSYSFE